MADYAKISVKGVYSKNSDYSFPKAMFAPDANTLTPDEYMHLEIEADTGGTTVTTSTLASATMVMVKNNDTTNYVTATFKSAGNGGAGGTNNIIRIAAGGFIAVTDFTVAGNLALAANSAACECEVFIIGT